jgi:ketosteroid isomerase-like protein
VPLDISLLIAINHMSYSNQVLVVQDFNSCINNRDLNGLEKLMTADHAFIDTAGTEFRGKEVVANAWKSFFEYFPDYRNVFEGFEEEGNTVIIKGYSTCSDRRLEGRGVWTAVIEEDKIKEWRVSLP